jgi:hypothetical protein
MSGTSMACPHVAGLLCLLRGAGLSPQECLAYLATHRHAVTGCREGALRLAADFGAEEGGTVDEAIARFEAIQAECDRDGLRYFEPTADMDRQAMEAFARDIQASLGLIYEHAEVGKASLKVPEPPTTDSFGGTYGGSEHGLAFDHYPGGEDGPHYGTAYHCPAAGIVSRYSFGPGPLDVQKEVGGTVRVFSQADAASTVAAMLAPQQLDAITALGTMMHIAVLTFDQSQQTPGGALARAIWIGHVQDGFPTGRRAAGNLFAVCGRSGIEFAGCDASHGHLCGTATGQLSPNGDIPGVEVARLLGFNPRVTTVPGPQEYMTGQYDRGKPR